MGGNYCMDIAAGGCPAMTGSGNSGSGSTCFEPYTQECNSTEIHCDAGMDSEGCWYGNYCIDSVNSWDSCPGMCSTMCNWDTEEWCDMGVDSNGCWMGNWCQDMTLGGCPDVTMVSKRGFMEKKKAMAHRAERQFFTSGSGSDYGTAYGSDYGSEYGSDYGFNYGSGSD